MDMKHGEKRDKSIAVMGAGAAGLAAAVYLREAGYTRITLYEREERPGGKCLTHWENGQPYELGAVLGIWAYRETLDLMKRAGVQAQYCPSWNKPDKRPDLKEKGIEDLSRTFPGYVSLVEGAAVLREYQRYKRLAAYYPGFFENPDMRDIPPELCQPFQKWCAYHKLEKLAKIMEIPFTTFGYGFFSEVPTAYVMKYLDPETVNALIKPKQFFIWPEGIQSLWERLAEDFDVRCGEGIVSVKRNLGADQGPVQVVTAGGEQEEYDYLIVTTPLDEWADMTEDIMDGKAYEVPERKLFSRIRYCDYYVYLAKISGMPLPSGFIPKNFCRDRLGHLMIWDNRWRKDGLFTLYILADGEQGAAEGRGTLGDKEIRNLLKDDLASMGAALEEVKVCRRWKYFPHVDGRDLKEGFYNTLEEGQGKGGVYFGGELMSFSTVERTVGYSRYLVERFFRG